MKHLLTITIFLTIGTLSVMAQPRLRHAEMYVGVHGGVEATMNYWLPKVEGTDQLLNTVLLGGNGGIRFRYIKHKYFGWQVELNYLQRGWREKVSATALNEGGTYTRRLHYLELPFLMHLYFGKRRWRGFFNLGPEIGYCIKESHSGVQHPSQTEQYKSLDHPFDWGVAGGAGFYYRNKKAGTFELEARFMFSMGDMFDNSKRAYFDQSHSMVLSLNLAYMWEFTSKDKVRKQKKGTDKL